MKMTEPQPQEEINFNLGTFIKNHAYLAVLIAILCAVLYGLSINKINNLEDQNILLEKDSILLKQYQNGFQQCRTHCLDNNQTGYIRAVSDLNHKCFCYERISDGMIPREE